MFELDDIMGNVLGAEVGYVIWWGIIKMRKGMKEIRKHEKMKQAFCITKSFLDFN